jgi:hypothetical protein
MVKSPAVPMAIVQGVGQVLPSDVWASIPGGFDSIRSGVVVGFALNASKLLQAVSPKPHITSAKARSSFMSEIPRSKPRAPPGLGSRATQARCSWRSRDEMCPTLLLRVPAQQVVGIWLWGMSRGTRDGREAPTRPEAPERRKRRGAVGRVAGKVSGRGSAGRAEAKRHWTRRKRSALLGNPPAISHSLPCRCRGHDYRAASTGPSPRFPRFAGPGSAVATYGAGAREITRAAGRATAPTTSSGVGDDPGKGGGWLLTHALRCREFDPGALKQHASDSPEQVTTHPSATV